MKKFMAFNILAGLMFAGGIPTLDAASVAKTAEQIKQTIDQTKQMVSGFKDVKKQIKDDISRIFDGDAAQMLGFVKAIQDKSFTFENGNAAVQGLLNSVKNDDRAQELIVKNLYEDYCENVPNEKFKQSCMNEVNAKFGNDKDIEKIHKNFDATVKDVNTAIGKMKSAKNQRESQDASNALQAALANLSLQEHQIRMRQMEYQLTKDMLADQKQAAKEETLKKMLSGSEGHLNFNGLSSKVGWGK